MKKFELIRKIFTIVMRVGFNDDKQDAISEYTKDKMTHKVYVKKVVIDDDAPNVDSVAVTSLENDFSDACDSDVRIAFRSNVGKRVILYANEIEYSVLQAIYEYLRSKFGENEDEFAYFYVKNYWDYLDSCGETVNLPHRELRYILDKFKETFIDKK